MLNYTVFLLLPFVNLSSFRAESLRMEILSYQMMNLVSVGTFHLFTRRLQAIYLHFRLIILLLLSPVLLCCTSLAVAFLTK